jgi:hypothetical protein
VLRYFYDDVVFRPEQMLAEIRSVLTGRPVPPGIDLLRSAPR